MKKIATGVTQWENRHETFTEQIKVMYAIGNEPSLGALDGYNDTTKGLQQVIQEAIDTNTPLRSLGAGWSWTKITTANNGIMIDTKPLNTTFSLSDQSVSPAYAGNIDRLVFAQCGSGVWELSQSLREINLSLKTSGASSGQTIVGAMSTGAHGSTVAVGGIQDYIVGLHLIVSPDKHIWLERKSAPVASTFFTDKLQTTLVQDDELFNAALVSFGSFGIIHGVLVETEPLYLIETNMQRMPYDDSIKNLMATLDFSKGTLPWGSERPFHFSVSLNPYDMDKGAYVYGFYKRPYIPGYTPPQKNTDGLGPGDDAPCFIGKLTNAIPALVPTVVNKLLGGALKPFTKQMGTLGEIFGNTTLHGKLMSAAIGLPLDKVEESIKLILQVNKTHGPFAGLIACRFIKKSEATLAFTHFNYTCIIELDGVFSNTTNTFYNEVWNRLDAENIPYTMHWGKMNELNPTRLSSMYGSKVDDWIAARNELLPPECMDIFSNEILHQWGLDKKL